MLFSVPDGHKVKLTRYEDINAGPRKIPTPDGSKNNGIPLADTDALVVDLDKKQVCLENKGIPVDLGGQIRYIVE